MKVAKPRSFQLTFHEPEILRRFYNTNARQQLSKGFRDEDFEPMFFEKMRDAMKDIEQQYAYRLNPTQPFVIRLDGHKFSSFCKYFKKPYDERTMLMTTHDVVTQFNPQCAYTESDEISLLFRAPLSDAKQETEGNKPEIPYGGKIAKLISLAAGYTSARFNYYISQQAKGETNTKLVSRMTENAAHFDARLFQLTDDQECLDNILWRMFDCRRNSIARFGQYYFTHKELEGMSCPSVIRSVELKHQVSWHDAPLWFRYGTILKKKQMLKEAFNPKTQQAVVVNRTVLCWAPATIIGSKCTPQGAQMLMQKLVSKEENPEAYDSLVPFNVHPTKTNES